MSLINDLEKRLICEIATASRLPGELLPSERVMAQEIGLSRSSINEVYRSLSAQGFIESSPGKRPRVINLFKSRFQALVDEMPGTSEDLSSIYSLRAQLEGEAAFYCAARATDEQLRLIELEYQAMVKRNQGETTLTKAKADLRFHTLIAECSHNLPVVSFSLLFYERFFNAIYTALDLTLKRYGRYPDGIRGQHAAIYQALLRRESDQARRAAIDHVNYTAARYNDAL